MNHIVRSSTLCTTDWCDAKKEIERLKAQVKDYQDACHQKQEILDSQKVQIVELAKESDALRKQVAELTQELEGQYVVTDVQVFDDASSAVKIMELQNELAAMTKVIEDRNGEIAAAGDRIAAAQARIVELREALEELACLGNGETYGNSIGNSIAIVALTTPDDSSALDRRLQEERERCAKVCDAIGCEACECAAAIREGGA